MNWRSTWERITHWELWHYFVKYYFIAPFWVWYCLRSGSLWFFSSSNPTITFGGFEGEGKKEMYDQLPAGTFPNTVYISPGQDFEEIKKSLSNINLNYPFIVKPDAGSKGLLFRKIDNEDELFKYHQLMPVEYLAQELVTYPLELSVFYYRFPNQKKGVITGFIQKDLMDVIGDGRHNLLQLIQQHPIAKFRVDELKLKHEDSFNNVIPQGERYILTYAANLSRGARFTNLEHLIDDDLLHVFDEISHRTSFYYGRYDLKSVSVDDLTQGKNFSILEFNGSGAEPNHIYHKGYSLLQAYRVIIFHWKILYEISKYNHRNGFPYWSFSKGNKFLKEAKKHLRVLEEYEKKILV
jgi:hypothetical protein